MIIRKLRYKLNLAMVFATLFLVSSCQQDEMYLYDKTGFSHGHGFSPINPYPQRYDPNVRPYSRAYTNPYAAPPRNYYPYYDYDQYYVPPTDYRNIEREYGYGGDPSDKY